MATERAVIYVPAGHDAEKWRLACTAYIQERGYQLVAVVQDGWDGAQAYADEGRADVVVVARGDHPPAHRVPRLEVVEEDGPAPVPPRRRPRLIRRDGAAEL